MPIADAQVVLDGTLGPSGSLSGPDVTIPAEVGRQVGSNLFHSFQTFSIYRNESATFTGPDGLANVISRVTGGQVSTIDGLLRSQVPNADFWFLNPAGVFFGPNARLDVPASFHVSTADEIRFPDGKTFSATDPGVSVLSVAPPEAFGFLSAPPGSINVEGSVLEVPAGETLSLVGGDLEITGGVGDGAIMAESGQVNIVSVTSPPGEVWPDDGVTTAAALGEVHLSSLATVDTSGWVFSSEIATEGGAGGTINVRAGRLDLDESFLYARGDGPDAGGRVDIQAQSVQLSNFSDIIVDGEGAGTIGIRSDIFTLQNARLFANTLAGTAEGTVGRITIEAGTVRLSNAAQIDASGEGGGEIIIRGQNVTVEDNGCFPLCSGIRANNWSDQNTAGGIDVEAETIMIRSGIIEANAEGAGRGGKVRVAASTLDLTDEANISASTYDRGEAGNLILDADRAITISGSGRVDASSHSEASDAGAAGDMSITTGRLSINDSIVTSATYGEGAGGNITISVDDLELRNVGVIATTTFGTGAAGNLAVVADGTIAISGEDAEGFRSGFFTNSQVNENGAPSGGDAGHLSVTAGQLVINDGDISSLTEAGGAGGDVAVDAGHAELTGSAVIRADTRSAGSAGNVSVKVNGLELTGGGRIQSNTFSTGPAGTVTIDARGGIITMAGRNLDGAPSGLLTESLTRAPNGGPAGRVHIMAEQLTIGNNALISSWTAGGGDGGEVDVDVGNLELTDGGQIRAQTSGSGPAGNVLIDARGGIVISGRGTLGFESEFANESGLFVNSERIVEEGAQQDSGPGGRLSIAAGYLTVGRGGLIASTTGEGSPGGEVHVDVGRLELIGGGQISASAFGKGGAGNLTINAREIDVAGQDEAAAFSSGLFVETYDVEPGGGAGGDLGVTADELRVRDGGMITSSTFGSGPAGSINVDANRLLISRGSSPNFTGIASSAREGSTGASGTVSVTAGEAEVRDGGRIDSSTWGTGDAGTVGVTTDRLSLLGGGQIGSVSFPLSSGAGGNVVVAARESLLISGRDALGFSSGVFANSESPRPDSKDGGTVQVSAPAMTLTDTGVIVSESFGGGKAGSIFIGRQEADTIVIGDGGMGEIAVAVPEMDTLRMGGGASISAQTARADAGDIVIQVDELIDLEDSAITTSVAGGQGAGGNISIDPRFLVLDNSRIVANAREGAGGNIDIIADFIFRSPESVIDASSQFGISGIVEIAATELDVTSGVVALPAAFLDPAALRARCGERRDGGTGSFTGIGRGGTGVAPDALLPGFYSDLTGSTGSSAATAAPTVSAAPPPVSNEKSMLAVSTWLTSCREE